MTWRQLVPEPIVTMDDAARFVTALGFCTWGPVPGLDFPNLAEAMGETASSVLDRTWFWKDDLHLERRIYYGKVIRGQPSFIDPALLPAFVAALGGAEQEVEREPANLFAAGRLAVEALTVYELLTEAGPLPTRALRRAAGLSQARQAAATERALLELQRRFLVCKADLTGRTRGTYSYVWDLAERVWPAAFQAARDLALEAARDQIRARLRQFGLTSGAALEARLFLWRAQPVG
jgi:hypothetical protein